MTRTLLKSKIHRARVTDACLDYEGSISIDRELCRAADLLQFEKVEIYNVNNGERFATYVIYGGPGDIILNGAAARLVQRNDLIIIASYTTLSETEAPTHAPKIVLVDAQNRIKGHHDPAGGVHV